MVPAYSLQCEFLEQKLCCVKSQTGLTSSFCLSFPWWSTLTWNCKQNKPLSPQSCFWLQIFNHINRNKTRTWIYKWAEKNMWSMKDNSKVLLIKSMAASLPCLSTTVACIFSPLMSWQLHPLPCLDSCVLMPHSITKSERITWAWDSHTWLPTWIFH